MSTASRKKASSLFRRLLGHLLSDPLFGWEQKEQLGFVGRVKTKNETMSDDITESLNPTIPEGASTEATNLSIHASLGALFC